MNRLILGALSGCAATMAMTVAMHRLHRRLPATERYPLLPREIVGSLSRERPEPVRPASGDRQATATMLAHFGYGALTGALFAAQRHRGVAPGAAYGVAVWAASYLGWIPGARILRPATQHPPRRNALMLAAHLVWGTTLALGLRELEAASEDSFSRRGEPLRDLDIGAAEPRQ